MNLKVWEYINCPTEIYKIHLYPIENYSTILSFKSYATPEGSHSSTKGKPKQKYKAIEDLKFTSSTALSSNSATAANRKQPEKGW